MDAVNDERRMSDGSGFREALSGDAFPITKRCHLRIGDRRSRVPVEISFRSANRSTNEAPAAWPLGVSVKKIFWRTL